jgi:undecaprenyl-diphosphatase
MLFSKNPSHPMIQPAPPNPADNITPPLFRSWRAWYALVLAALAAELGLFVYLTHFFA